MEALLVEVALLLPVEAVPEVALLLVVALPVVEALLAGVALEAVTLLPVVVALVEELPPEGAEGEAPVFPEASPRQMIEPSTGPLKEEMSDIAASRDFPAHKPKK